MGTGITDADGRARLLRRRHPRLRRRARQGRPARSSSSTRASRSRDGDVFVTNDPFYGGVTHLNDVVLAMPVFADGELVAWTANIAHWNDVGGMVPGSISNDAREIFQEGLRLPAVKLIDQGMPIHSRDADHGGQLPPARLPAGRHVGRHRGRPDRRAAPPGARRPSTAATTFLAAIDALHGLRRAGLARRRCASCPRAASSSRRSRTAAPSTASTVEITDDAFIVDLRDNPDQDDGPNNASRDGAMIAAQMVFMTLTDPYGVGQRRLVPPAGAPDPARLGVRRPGAGRVRDLLRGRGPPLRPDLALPGAASRRPPAGRALREHLRHVHRRPAPRHRPALHDRRAAARRLGRLSVARRQQRDLHRLPRRDVQLPRRGRRDALRPVRRPHRAQRRAGRRGRAPRRQGHRPRLPRPHATAASSPAPTRATRTCRGRSTAAARARRTSPR